MRIEPSNEVPNTNIMLCPQCRRETLAGRHCKLLCYACGYVESCEDNFVIAAEPRDELPTS